MNLNAVQKAAYELIREDARFLYSLSNLKNHIKNTNSNYILMCQPYIGLFADGAEQWCRKLGLPAPKFSDEEKQYYSVLRSKHKLYELPYIDYLSALVNKLGESDAYFYSIRSPLEKIVGYYNVGTDLCGGEYCGNTILCALYSPVDILHNEKIGSWLRGISVVAGRLASYFECTKHEPYVYNERIHATYKDYHFYRKCPISNKTDVGFFLFSVLCSVNYVVRFINEVFLEEIPQKFKFAYLQYYYLCSLIPEFNAKNGTNLSINGSLIDRKFRNCLAHYGLGQYLAVSEIRSYDPLKGLTQKAFNLDYLEAKAVLYTYLTDLTEQIKLLIF